ncbi:cytochrome c biogenesis protein ResB [Luteipulveratus sp. YIM 133132]|uniref:cytochrome c biogenesis protein ResB n=1 Tax=Luteipulveratus flavus TaxID=3031728 RepID=UPI0023AF5A47|nr:cytochrome c biogenesis protein ResB [Luteipulveratus sp. YIM 133132]MDE9365021.1 cytochrome c biogenesis protein ResB [Luteipulveratus sp. YIM 133132]
MTPPDDLTAAYATTDEDRTSTSSKGSGDGPTLPRLGFLGGLRWFWRQLTSMRTALFLLLLLAIAAVPGSIWPQRGIDAVRVSDYLAQHTTIGPWLDRFGFFDVYSSPWFAAIYLLLVVSLLGCILPRTKQHWQNIRSQPPKAPRRLERLPAHTSATVDASHDDVLAAAREVLRSKRFRLRVQDDAVSGEVGALRETGNLLFHVSLVVVIVAVAAGHVLGWRGDVIVPEGGDFASTVTQYDTIDPGPWVDVAGLTPWSLHLDKLHVSFEDGVPTDSPQYGQPRSFTADVTTGDEDGRTEQRKISVNHPINEGGASVYLLGNGYAPVVTVRDKAGKVLYRKATPFLPQDNTYKSVGAVKVTGATPQQLGFAGFFVPSLDFDDRMGPISTFPGLRKPALVLTAFEGDLFPDGRPQSVYTLNTAKMTQLKGANGQPLRLLVTPGQTVQLPGGQGSVTLERQIPRWAGLSVRSDPGKIPALIGALAGLAGLVMSLTLRRRRVFVRVAPAPPTATSSAAAEGGERRTLVTVGGLAKGEDPRLGAAVEEILAAISTRTGRPA